MRLTQATPRIAHLRADQTGPALFFSFTDDDPNHHPKAIVVVTMVPVVAIERRRVGRIVVPRTAPHDEPGLPDSSCPEHRLV